MSHCKIWLENYTGTYYPGTLIQGKIICNFDSKTTLRAVKLRVKGREHTEWLGEESYHDQQSNSQKTRNVNFTGDNEFLSYELILYGSKGQETSLGPGQHIYPFSYTLPYNIPSSFNSSKGSIGYRFIAIVDRPMRTDYEDEAIFNVIAPIDFSRIVNQPDLLGPSSYSESKSVCCLWCASGPISLDVELSKRAACAGETIPLKVRITNHSNVNVEELKVTLTQRIDYKVTQPTSDEKTDKTVLLKIKDVGVGAHGEHTYDLKLQIPQDLVVPNFDQCSLFKADHLYTVVAELSSCHQDLEVEMYPVLSGAPGGGQFPPPAQNTPPVQYPSSPQYPPPVLYPTNPQYPPPTQNTPPVQYPTTPQYPLPPPNSPPVQYPPPGQNNSALPYPPAGPGQYPTTPTPMGFVAQPTSPGYPSAPTNPTQEAPVYPQVPPSYDSIHPPK